MTTTLTNVQPSFDVSHSRILRIAFPALLASITAPIAGLVDITVIGQLGNTSLVAGLAIGSVVFDFFYMAVSFLRVGTTGLTAQALGRNDFDGIKNELLRPVIFSILLGVAILILQKPFFLLATKIYHLDPQVEQAFYTYFTVRIYSLPFGFTAMAIAGWLLGLARTKALLFIEVLYTICNVTLSVWFVFGLELEVFGVALATLIAEITITGCFVVIAYLYFKGKWQINWHKVFNSVDLRKTFKLSRDILFRALLLYAAIALFIRGSSELGTTILAINSILTNILVAVVFILDGFGVASEQLAGRAIGANNQVLFRITVIRTGMWSLAASITLSVLLYFFLFDFVNLLTTAEDIRNGVAPYAIWVILDPIVSFLPFTMDSIFIGATWSKVMRNTMAIAIVVYVFCYWWLSTILGNQGLWAAYFIFLIVRGLLTLYYLPIYERKQFGRSEASWISSLSSR